MKNLIDIVLETSSWAARQGTEQKWTRVPILLCSSTTYLFVEIWKFHECLLHWDCLICLEYNQPSWIDALGVVELNLRKVPRLKTLDLRRTYLNWRLCSKSLRTLKALSRPSTSMQAFSTFSLPDDLPLLKRLYLLIQVEDLKVHDIILWPSLSCACFLCNAGAAWD